MKNIYFESSIEMATSTISFRYLTSPSDGNYSGKSWINSSLKAAGFRETQCVVHRCLFSVCAMELCLSTPVTVSMVEQYGSMGNKFTRCLGHIVRPICVHPVYMCIGNNDLINVHAPFIANKPTRWKTKRAIESTDSSGVARLIIERAFIVDSWKKWPITNGAWSLVRCLHSLEYRSCRLVITF